MKLPFNISLVNVSNVAIYLSIYSKSQMTAKEYEPIASWFVYNSQLFSKSLLKWLSFLMRTYLCGVFGSVFS